MKNSDRSKRENATIYICYLPEVETGYKIEFYYQKPRTMINENKYTKTKYISKTGEINEDDDEIFDAQIDGIKENYVFDHMNTQGNFPFTANTPESHVVKLYYNYDNNGTTYIINYYYNGVKGNTENITENELTVEIINNKIISHRNYNGKVYNYTPIVEDDLLALDSENNIIDSGLCTKCKSDYFHSRRAENDEVFNINGSLMSLI